MKILFIHQNFPSQFRFLAPALQARGDEVVALTMKQTNETHWQGIRVISYSPRRSSTPNIHPWVSDFEAKTIRGEACFTAALALKAAGYTPDLIIAHPGWGESLFVKQVWPNTKLAIYCEFHYQDEGADADFDPEFVSSDLGAKCRLQLKNLNNLAHFEYADAAISPTYWQASTFPERFRSKITVVHDGIDTSVVSPNCSVTMTLSNGRSLKRGDEIITFVNRNLEPYRGYHIFMRALPKILYQRPNATVLIVGGNDVSYGAGPAHGENWKDIFIKEVRPLISDSDWQRVNFLGQIPYKYFVPLLQLSALHVYFTYPFVLSWSLLEAMSAGCAIVASDTKPLQEAITDGETGRLVNFFDVDALVNQVCDLLQDNTTRHTLGANARRFAQTHYDLQNVCLPQQLRWVDQICS